MEAIWVLTLFVNIPIYGYPVQKKVSTENVQTEEAYIAKML